MRNMEFPVDEDIARKIREDADLQRFHESEIIPENETEKQELLRGEELRRRVIRSLR